MSHAKTNGTVWITRRVRLPATLWDQIDARYTKDDPHLARVQIAFAVLNWFSLTKEERFNAYTTLLEWWEPRPGQGEAGYLGQLCELMMRLTPQEQENVLDEMAWAMGRQVSRRPVKRTAARAAPQLRLVGTEPDWDGAA